MTGRQWIYLALLVPFLAQTGWVLATVGFVGFYEEVFRSGATRLMGMDLSIALGLILVWMWSNARQSHTPFVPYLVITLAIGVAGPLGYLIHREAVVRRTELRGVPAAS